MDVGSDGRLTGFADKAGAFSFGVCVTDHVGREKCGTVKLRVVQAQQSTLTVTLAGSGGGLVESEDAAISCGDFCKSSYDNGSKVTLTASPDDGSTFTGWSGACTGTNDCVIDVKADANVTANFTQTLLSTTTTPLLTVTDSQGTYFPYKIFSVTAQIIDENSNTVIVPSGSAGLLSFSILDQ